MLSTRHALCAAAGLAVIAAGLHNTFAHLELGPLLGALPLVIGAALLVVVGADLAGDATIVADIEGQSNEHIRRPCSKKDAPPSRLPAPPANRFDRGM